jgi:hypothetical protein
MCLVPDQAIQVCGLIPHMMPHMMHSAQLTRFAPRRQVLTSQKYPSAHLPIAAVKPGEDLEPLKWKKVRRQGCQIGQI